MNRRPRTLSPATPAASTPPAPSADVLALAQAFAALPRLAALADRLEAALARLDAVAPPAAAPAVTTDADRPLSVADWAKRTGVSYATANRLIAEGTLKTVKIGRRRLVPAHVARETIGRGIPDKPS